MSIPWRKINELLLHAGSAPDRRQLLERLAYRVDKLIPYDVDAMVFDQQVRCIGHYGLNDDRMLKAYNERYRFRLPFVCFNGTGASAGKPFVFYSEYARTEFVTDFARPLGLSKSLHSIGKDESRSWPTDLAIFRSRFAPKFTDSDRSVLDIVNSHLNVYLTIFNKIEVVPHSRLPSPDLIETEFPKLSQREAEVAALLCLGLTAHEISLRLFVSRRTVETHILHVCEKLNVQRRATAVRTLMLRVNGRAETL
jgi:DNA-binding CsgD family transcriptional regulator